VTIEDELFVGHGVVFINDRQPRATRPDGTPQSEHDWHLERTIVRCRASIGSGAIIMCSVKIGDGAMVERARSSFMTCRLTRSQSAIPHECRALAATQGGNQTK
jgi:hypothetical protein